MIVEAVDHQDLIAVDHEGLYRKFYFIDLVSYMVIDNTVYKMDFILKHVFNIVLAPIKYIVGLRIILRLLEEKLVCNGIHIF